MRFIIKLHFICLGVLIAEMLTLPGYSLAAENRFDIDRLAYAVAMAETGDCTTGVGATKNNCHGIVRDGEYVTYATPAESYAAFKYTWSRRYSECPTMQDALVYVHGHKYKPEHDPSDWLRTVKKLYPCDPVLP